MKMIKQPTIPPMPKQPTFDARDTQYNLPIGTDLISRTQAIDAVNRLSLGETDATRLAMRIGDYLERLPSAQPEIIRCKDCKHYKYGICKKAGLCVNKSPNGFCDWGEVTE